MGLITRALAQRTTPRPAPVPAPVPQRPALATAPAPRAEEAPPVPSPEDFDPMSASADERVGPFPVKTPPERSGVYKIKTKDGQIMAATFDVESNSWTVEDSTRRSGVRPFPRGRILAWIGLRGRVHHERSKVIRAAARAAKIEATADETALPGLSLNDRRARAKREGGDPDSVASFVSLDDDPLLGVPDGITALGEEDFPF